MIWDKTNFAKYMINWQAYWPSFTIQNKLEIFIMN
jgi:hypothetical protein